MSLVTGRGRCGSWPYLRRASTVQEMQSLPRPTQMMMARRTIGSTVLNARESEIRCGRSIAECLLKLSKNSGSSPASVTIHELMLPGPAVAEMRFWWFRVIQMPDCIVVAKTCSYLAMTKRMFDIYAVFLLSSASRSQCRGCNGLFALGGNRRQTRPRSCDRCRSGLIVVGSVMGQMIICR